MVNLSRLKYNIQIMFYITEIISSDSNSADQRIEATVTHILLAFHMLFINILILNLLIAVFK
jgi:membrane-associated protease RseP (regulator of RpoE activity)